MINEKRIQTETTKKLFRPSENGNYVVLNTYTKGVRYTRGLTVNIEADSDYTILINGQVIYVGNYIESMTFEGDGDIVPVKISLYTEYDRPLVLNGVEMVYGNEYDVELYTNQTNIITMKPEEVIPDPEEPSGEIALAGMLDHSDPDYGGSSFTLTSYGNRNTITVPLKEDGCSFEIPMSDFVNAYSVTDTEINSSDGKYRQIFKTGSRKFRTFSVFNIPVNTTPDDDGAISMRGLFDTCKLYPLDESEKVIDLRNTGDWTNVNIYREMFKSMGANFVTFVLPSGFFENATDTRDIFKSTPSDKTFVCDLMSDTAFDNFRACVPSTQNENFVFKKGDITYTTAYDESGNTYWIQG